MATTIPSYPANTANTISQQPQEPIVQKPRPERPF